jgi:dCMP deaminase
MASQNKLDKTYIEICRVWSTMSVSIRKKVGCIIVKDGQIISDGYNGTPTGFDNTCEYTNIDADGYEVLSTKPEVLHAESNCIAKLAKSTNSSVGSTLYTTMSPCYECAKLIIQAGITRVVYAEIYRNLDGVTLLQRSNVGVYQI